MKFDVVNKRFEEKGCRLTRIQEDYKSNQRVEFIGKCGHPSQASIDNFTSCDTGVICKKCSDENRKKIQGGQGSSAREIEYEGFVYFKTILESHFDILKTNEGCIADFCIRPKGSGVDEWLQVQTKSTKQPYQNSYAFRINKNVYTDCIVMCVAMDTKKVWVFDCEEVNGKYKQSVSSKRDGDINIIEKLETVYKTIQLFPSEEVLIPQSVYQKREHEYRLKREKMFPELHFEYPDVEGQKYDFIVNGMKVQEKVAGKRKSRKNYYVALLYSPNRTKQKYNTYKKGDCDFYWVWLDGTDEYFVIPESSMIENGLVETDKNRPTLHIHEKSWVFNLKIQDRPFRS